VRRRGVIFAAAGIALLAGGLNGWACSCVARATCGSARYGTVDFIGEILSGRLVPSNGIVGGNADSYLTRSQQVLVEIRIIESFRGPQKPGDIVSIRTGQGGGDCGYPFKLGKKFLIDATEENGTLYTGICSLTAPVDEATVEIESLRRLAAGQRVPDLTGLLYKVSSTSEDWDKRPLAGIQAQLASLSGKKLSATAITNSEGVFSFTQVPSGRYQLSLLLPQDLSPVYANFGRTNEKDEIPPLTIPASDRSSAACHVEVYVDSSASISGMIKAPRPGPVAGWVNADTVKPDRTPWSTVLSATPAADGSFRLAHLPPGRYQIKFTAREGFVEGVPQIIVLGDGEKRTGVVLAAK